MFNAYRPVTVLLEHVRTHLRTPFLVLSCECTPEDENEACKYADDTAASVMMKWVYLRQHVTTAGEVLVVHVNICGTSFGFFCEQYAWQRCPTSIRDVMPPEISVSAIISESNVRTR